MRYYATIATRSFLPSARVLAQSIRQWDHDCTVLVLVADGLQSSQEESFQAIPLSAMPNQEAVAAMSFYYRPLEFCCALRGVLHDYMLKVVGANRWIFLDSDMLVLGPLDAVWDELQRASIALSPHLLRPVGSPDHPIDELRLLRSGTFNGGLLGLKSSETTRAFVQWFGERLQWFASANETRLYLDQRWLDLVPSLFRDVAIVSHPGVNVAWWNLHERNLVFRDDSRWEAGGKELLLFHFSGWSPATPTRLTSRTKRDSGKPDAWEPLGREYLGLLSAAGLDAATRIPYGFSTYVDGTRISDEARRIFRDDLRKRKAGISPFERPGYFRRRALSPQRWIQRIGRRVARRFASEG